MKVYKDILLEKERLKLLEYIKTTVKNLGSKYPGLQSKPNLHTDKEMLPLIKIIKNHLKGYNIERCWANFSMGDYMTWHAHPEFDISVAYYLKNPSSIGTVFKKDGFGVHVPECPENSLLIFDSKLVHSVPYHLKEERYSIAVDLIKI